MNKFSLMFDVQHAQMSYQCWLLIDSKYVGLRWAIVLIFFFLEIAVDVYDQIWPITCAFEILIISNCQRISTKCIYFEKAKKMCS